MALNINPLVTIRQGLFNVNYRISQFNLNTIIPLGTEAWFGATIRGVFMAGSSQLNDVCGDIRGVIAKIDELNAFLSDKMALVDDAKAKLDEIKAKIGSAADGFAALERRMGEYADDRRNQAVAQLNEYKVQVDNWANAELRPRLNSLEQYRTDVEAYFNNDLRPKVNSLRADVNNVGNVVNAMTNDRINAARAVADDARARVEGIYTKLPKRTPEEQWAYFSNLARPTFEKSMDFAVQNSLWNLRNKQAGSLEWDGIAKETTDKANAALAAATENARQFDAKLAEMIAGTNGRTTELENKLPLTTAALNKRVDESNQAATDQANAALAAANENITSVRTDLEDRLRIETQLTSELKSRMDRMELQIDKVAPLLAKIPKLPGG
jgi:chromosome segregation ATPase